MKLHLPCLPLAAALLLVAPGAPATSTPLTEAAPAAPMTSSTPPSPLLPSETPRGRQAPRPTEGKVLSPLPRLPLAHAEPLPKRRGDGMPLHEHHHAVKAAPRGSSPKGLAAGQMTEEVSTPPAGPHLLTVVSVVPKGVKGTPASEKQMRGQVAGADAYWREVSQGAISFAVEKVAPSYRSSFSCSDAPFSLWTEAARATGFQEGPHRHLVLVFPREAALASSCAYGLATLGGDAHTGGLVYASDTAWPVLAHELGHNLSLNHARSLRCPTSTDAASSRWRAQRCSKDEYGDVFDVMGASAPRVAGTLSTPQAARIGILPSSAVATVASGARRVTLQAVGARRGLRALRLVDPRTSQVYWVEVRGRLGRDKVLYAPAAYGVRLLREDTGPAGGPASSLLLDATPTKNPQDLATVLPVGSTFTSYGGGVTVKVLSLTPSFAVVEASASSVVPKGLIAGRVLAGRR